MQKVQDVVWAVIGAGRVCEKKSMPAMNIIPHSRVKTVMQRSAPACKDFAFRHNIPNWTTDIRDILSDPEINAVYIGTPPDTHASYAIQVAMAGKAVYVEKPMARNYQECLSMIQVCKRSDVPLFVAYYRRTLPHFLRIKELIETGAIGKVISVNIIFHRSLRPTDGSPTETNWRLSPEISGGGYFHDLASHQLDLMDFIFGPIIDIRSKVENRAGLYVPPDTLNTTFGFANGVMGSGSWSFIAPKTEERDDIYILGETGKLHFSTFAHAKIDIESEALGTFREEKVLPEHIQEFLIRTIVDQLRGVGTCPSTGETAARTSRVMDIICSNT